MINLRCNFRGVVGKKLTEKDIKQFAKKVVGYIYSNKYQKAVVIGKDNRLSSDYILSVLQTTLLHSGIVVHIAGECTTPQLVYLTKRFKFSLGIMITASHNSYEYNGLKCFNSLGRTIDMRGQEIKRRVYKRYEKVVDISKFKELYLRELKNQLNYNKIKCVFDCANGASVEVVRNVFAKHQIIGADTSGRYINDGNGSEHLNAIRTICKRNKKIGFAFDGDGDRVIAIDSNGDVIDGDKIVYILATQQLGFGDKVVGTQISSLGLEISLRRIGVGLVRVKVGSQFVEEKMLKENIKLGGESCGHVFSPNVCRSDGVLVAIELLNILNRTEKTFSELLTGYKQMYQIARNIKIKGLENIDEFEQSSKDMRIVVRRSINEPILRVFIEGVDEGIVKMQFDRLIQDIKRKYAIGELCD